MRGVRSLCAVVLYAVVLCASASLFAQQPMPMGHPPSHIQQLHPGSRGAINNQSAPNCTPATVSYYGGPIVSHPNVVTVFWGSSAYSSYADLLSSFYTAITNSAYIDWLSEYDTIGLLAADSQPGTNQAIVRGSFGGKYTITPSVCTSSCTIDDIAIQSELLSQVNAGHLPAPTTDHDGNVNTAYMIYFPSTVTITLQGSTSCVQFCAYHGTTTNLDAIESKHLLYGVLPDITVGGCAGGCGSNANQFNNITGVSSHELGELMTDADVGIASVVGRPVAWYSNSCGEIGDMCNAQDATVGSYTVQQLWSNKLQSCIVSNPSVGVGAGPKYQVTASATSTTVGTSTAITVYAGSSGRPLVNYLGTVHFTSSDSSAVLPSDYTFTSSNMGSHGFNVIFNAAGSQTVTATDTNASEMTGSLMLPVNGGDTTHFLVTLPASTVPTIPFNFSVSARDAANNIVSTYSGTVHFTSTDVAAVLPADSTLLSGTGTFSATLNTLGTESISAIDLADKSITGMGSTKVAKLTSSTSLSAKPNPAAVGQLITFAIVVKSSSGIPAGTVTLNEGSTVLATGALDGTGHASFGVSSLAQGSHSIFASYGGNAVYTPGKSGTLTITVKVGTTTAITSAVPNPTTYDTPVQLTAHVTSASNDTPAGNVTFKAGSLVLGTAALDPSDNAGITTSSTALNGGSHLLTAVYSGDATHLGSTSGVYAEQVNKAVTATALTASATTAPVNTSVTFTATVTSPTGLIPPGKVTFKAGSAILGTATLNGSGLAALNYSFATAGTYLVKATYNATQNFAASTSTGVTESMTP